jgi:hypothetical protein
MRFLIYFIIFTRFDVLLAVLMEIQVFWDVMLWQLVNSYQHFGCVWCLWLQGQAIQVPLLVLLNPGRWGHYTPLKVQGVFTSRHCVTFHNTWMLIIFILIFWIGCKSVILETYYYIDTSQSQGRNVKYINFQWNFWQTVDMFIICIAKYNEMHTFDQSVSIATLEKKTWRNVYVAWRF